MPLKLLDDWWKHDFACAEHDRSTEIVEDAIFVRQQGREKVLTTEEVFKEITKQVSLPLSSTDLTISTYRISLPAKIIIVCPTTKEMLSEMYREKAVLIADNARLYLPESNGIEGCLTVWWLHS
ncbi:MAG: hypothetical protein NUV65_00085 [Candidatus Roizmanbacteria bacterium]|nr:hypothetical protein [Candidatus Roizmanbacteria bacterium]